MLSPSGQRVGGAMTHTLILTLTLSLSLSHPRRYASHNGALQITPFPRATGKHQDCGIGAVPLRAELCRCKSGEGVVRLLLCIAC